MSSPGQSPEPEVPASPGATEGEAARAEVLRRGYAEGRAQHGPLDLPYDAFARRALTLTERRLRRAGGAAAGAEVADALARAALADLFLAVACEEGVPGAWERFTERFGRTIVALSVRRGARGGEAEDLARELPGELFTPPPRGGARTRLGTYDGAGSLTGWLAVIVQRRLADRRREAPRSAPGGESAAPDDRAPDPADLAAGVEAGRRFDEAFREAWASLTDREALVLLFKYRDGLPQKEIARILDVGEPRVSRTIGAASEKIRAAVVRRIGLDPPGEGRDPGQAWAELSRAVAGFMATLPPSSDPSADG